MAQRYLTIILLLAHLRAISTRASNSLIDCQAIAQQFTTSNFTRPVANITVASEINMSCCGMNATLCPGRIDSNGNCVFESKLCVTCTLENSIARIKIQSNGLPPYCPVLSGIVPLREQNIDFAVNFNPDVSVLEPRINMMIQIDIGYSRLFVSVNSIAGISIDGVPIFNVDSTSNQDVYYPITGPPTDWGDQCFAHPSLDSIYHYHIDSGCALEPPVGQTTLCNNIPPCRRDGASYSMSMFRDYQNLTVLGVAKDGHVVYGPYTPDRYYSKSRR
ncbi:unnamed protein product [Rotaria sp. Silwood2]|nr:unnamed protein product [Rotaria sp. Silwood2]CAF3065092.1 unnamed protein product [Rotaria sp. Silwood2]CAF3303356.1 unnamed protein product [Rotaria sp. Silwood2]CAF3380210.1 unnamed protein product [Rotaria sp. Silwood2]CAF4165293.1 unnamed protein product [Rotaria sp. Silwood2]